MGLGACIFLGLGACIFLGLLEALSGCGASAPVIEADVARVLTAKGQLASDIAAGPLASGQAAPNDAGCDR